MSRISLFIFWTCCAIISGAWLWWNITTGSALVGVVGVILFAGALVHWWKVGGR